MGLKGVPGRVGLEKILPGFGVQAKLVQVLNVESRPVVGWVMAYLTILTWRGVHLTSESPCMCSSTCCLMEGSWSGEVKGIFEGTQKGAERTHHEWDWQVDSLVILAELGEGCVWGEEGRMSLMSLKKTGKEKSYL